MFDTTLTVIGNLLAAPEWRRTTSGQAVASFRVASTARRFDKVNNEWIDGNSLRVRVTCWRRLADGVAESLTTGDPVIVVGRLYTRDWMDESGTRRVFYEMDAVSVGHDLSRGTATFKRRQATPGTSVIEDDEEAARIGDEDSVPLMSIGSEEDLAEEELFDELEEDRRQLVAV